MVKDLTIIIADDDRDDRQFMSEALRRSNFNGLMQYAEDGNKLLKTLKSEIRYTLPHLILLDLNMPFKNGLEALEEIKLDDNLKVIPTVVITTSVNKEQEQKCYQLGAAGFYSKPVSISGYDQMAGKIMDLIQQVFK